MRGGGFGWKRRCPAVDLSIPKGLLGEQEFYKTVLLDSQWTMEPYRPNPDDEEVDYQIHFPGQKSEITFWQIKTTFQLRLIHNTHIAHFVIVKKLENLFTHPRMWYCLAHFGEEIRAFEDPLFVVPATFLHRLGKPMSRGRVRFEIDASVEP